MKKLLTTCAVGLAATGLAATTIATGASAAENPNIVELAVGASGTPFEFDDNDNDFDILVAAVVELKLADELSADRDLTVFAPDDGAFIKLAEFLTGTTGLSESDAFTAVASFAGDVAGIVRYHVAPGEREASSVVPARQIRTITKEFITKDRGATTLDAGSGRTANITGTDLQASNGIVHVIDQVLLPEG